MRLSRRRFVQSASLLACGIQSLGPNRIPDASEHDFSEASMAPPSFSVIPIIGDGKWIWTEPPEGETGYLEPREFEVTTGIIFLGKGRATQIQASTVAPVQFPEQQITDFKIKTNGCDAKVLKINDTAAQLVVAAPTIEKRQVISATARYRMKVYKDYRGFSKASFAENQSPKKTSMNGTPQGFGKQFLSASPGIKLRSSVLKKTLETLTYRKLHPWDQAKTFYDWVWNNIKGVPGKYTSVEEAIKKKRGDCEERAAVFIAMCRSAGIPARLVWVPCHNWAEIGLYDHDGQPHWIPVHTAAYSWFGWTGAHEVILQKGDRIDIAYRKQPMRLIDDWYRLHGATPKITFTSTVVPIATEKSDAGPGAREKLSDGTWRLNGDYSQGYAVRGS